MSEYNSIHKGTSVDQTVSSGKITVDDITALNAIDVTKITVGKIVEVLDIGDGIKADYLWNGASWQLDAKDLVKIKQGGKIESENGDVLIELMETGDDKGWAVKGGQFSVGSREQPTETIFGAGDSVFLHDGFNQDVVFHCTIDNTTGSTITSAVDVSAILASESGSSTGFFGGTQAGDYMLVGSEYPYSGFKVKYASLATVEPENVKPERLETTGWLLNRVMGTNSNPPYQQNGWVIANHTTEQLFYGLRIFDKYASTWTKIPLTINGQVIEKYWGRFRVDADISGDPQVEQIKFHTNRTEVEPSGICHRYGLARLKRTLQGGVRQSVKNDLQDPSNEKVSYTQTYVADYQDNEFSSGVYDSFGYVQTIEEGLDTSTDLEVAFSWYVKGSQTGDILFRVESVQVGAGFIYDGDYGEAIKETFEQVVTIDTDSDEVRQVVRFAIPINKLSGNSGVVLNIGRVGNDASDTLNSSVIVTNVVISGLFWET